MIERNRIRFCAWLVVVVISLAVDVSAQRKTKKKPAQAAPSQASELTKLRKEYVRLTNEYKAGLGKIIPYQEIEVKKAEEKLEQSKKLFAEGLIARAHIEENERALEIAKQKLAETNRQITSADEQIAAIVVETAADEEISKNLRRSEERRVGKGDRSRWWQ